MAAYQSLDGTGTVVTEESMAQGKGFDR